MNDVQCMFDELNQPIEIQEVLDNINQLRPNASGGPDCIINPFLIYGKDVLAPYLCQIFNIIFAKGYFPKQWSEGFIIPLHKKGPQDIVDNYRGITLLSSLGKLFTRILNSRLSSWAELYSIYIEAQCGFRAGMGTVDCVYILHALIAHFVNRGEKLYCGFIDFTKAFDYIVRENLWWKLINSGVTGNMLNIMRSMYNSAKSVVKCNGHMSEPILCKTGVRQGECLSPFLFSFYVNDIEKEFREKGLNGIDLDMLKIFLILYADDMVIFANSPEDLQDSFDMLVEYCKRWRLQVNTSKTKIMIFHKGRLLDNLIFKYPVNLYSKEYIYNSANTY